MQSPLLFSCGSNAAITIAIALIAFFGWQFGIVQWQFNNAEQTRMTPG